MNSYFYSVVNILLTEFRQNIEYEHCTARVTYKMEVTIVRQNIYPAGSRYVQNRPKWNCVTLCLRWSSKSAIKLFPSWLLSAVVIHTIPLLVVGCTLQKDDEIHLIYHCISECQQVYRKSVYCTSKETCLRLMKKFFFYTSISRQFLVKNDLQYYYR